MYMYSTPGIIVIVLLKMTPIFFIMSFPSMLGIVGHLQHFFQEMINAQQIPKGREMGGLGH